MRKQKPERIHPMPNGGMKHTPVVIPVPLTAAEKIVADKYSPFKDPNPPNFLKYAKRVTDTWTHDVGVRVPRVINGREIIVEYRGTFPAFLFGSCGVVGGYDTAHFFERHPHLAKKAGKAVAA